MKILSLKTKDALRVGVSIDTSFRAEKFEIEFKDGFFVVRDKNFAKLVYVPASNVAYFEVEPEAASPQKALKKSA
jgi:hypothetical protein